AAELGLVGGELELAGHETAHLQKRGGTGLHIAIRQLLGELLGNPRHIRLGPSRGRGPRKEQRGGQGSHCRLHRRLHLVCRAQGLIALEEASSRDLCRTLQGGGQLRCHVWNKVVQARGGGLRAPCSGGGRRRGIPALRRAIVAVTRVHPALAAVRVALLLPEGSAGLEIVHQELGGGEGGLAMRRGGDD